MRKLFGTLLAATALAAGAQTGVVSSGPAASAAEKDGSLTNTMRLAQWHQRAVDSPGDARSDAAFIVDLGNRLKKLYAEFWGPRLEHIHDTPWHAGVRLLDDEGRPYLAQNIQIGSRTRNARAYAASLNFRGADQQKKVGDLSGGERNRVHLAKLLRSGGNVLLLDEPTNDLDVDTLRALEEALLEFAGCAVVITHDRWFLDRVATHILAFEGDSQTEWFEGSWGDYVEWVKETRGPEALEPHRIKYKPLVRA